MAKVKGVPKAPKVRGQVARSASARGALGGRPSKTGTKETKGKAGKGERSGRAVFV